MLLTIQHIYDYVRKKKTTSKQKEQHTKMQAQSIYNDVRTRNMNFVKEPNT